MSFRLVPKLVTLNGVMAVALCYFTEFGKPALQTICGGIYARVYFLVRVQCRRKESSRSLAISSSDEFLVIIRA